MHLPLAYLLLNEEDATIIYEFDRQNLSLNILTGLQALSRSSENQNLVVAASEINAVLPAFTSLGLSKKWNFDTIAESILVSNGVNVKALQFTKEELAKMQAAEEQANAQQQAQAQMMGGQAEQQMGAQQLAGQDNAVDALNSARGMM